jgi:small basic protein
MSSLIDDVAQYLQDQGIGTIATDLFKANMPDSPDDAIVVLATGGTVPDPYLPTASPTFQVYIRSSSYTAGDAKLQAVRAALHRQFNRLLVNTSSIYFYKILAVSEGGHLGRDENKRETFSINFQCLTR